MVIRRVFRKTRRHHQRAYRPQIGLNPITSHHKERDGMKFEVHFIGLTFIVEGYQVDEEEFCVTDIVCKDSPHNGKCAEFLLISSLENDLWQEIYAQIDREILQRRYDCPDF